MVTILGHMPEPGVGESLRISGTWRSHPRYGQQFRMEGYRVLLPSDVDGIQKYLQSGLIKGVGPKIVARLVAHFKEETLDVIDKDPDRLEEVKGIGKETANRIALAWKVHHGLKRLMDFLQDNGLKASYGARVYKLYGTRALDILQNDPWQVAHDLPRIGFMIADTLMRNAGVEATDNDRVKACILHLLFTFAEDGNVCIREEDLLERCLQKFQVDERYTREAIDQLSAEHEIVVETDPEFAADRYLYLLPLHQAEIGIAHKLSALLSNPVDRPEIDTERIHETVLKHLALKLSPEQLEVVQNILDHRVAVITGGPGTGKTTLVRSITAVFSSIQMKVYLCAPTGRAARRLAELTRKQAATIHRMLGFNVAEGQFEKNRDNPLQADVVIVDEASMVDTVLMVHLLNALHLDTRIILVGDVFQLPSVGPGNVLADLIGSGRLRTYELTTVFRQTRESPIVINAHRIRGGQYPVLPDEGYGDDLSEFYFIDRYQPEAVARLIVELCGRSIPDQFGFDPIHDIQVLVPMHKGIVGTFNLNQRLQEGLNPNTALIQSQGQHFRPGDKVMHLKNNYSKDVFNGDSGIITDIDTHNNIVSVDYDGKIVEYDAAELDEISLAYAITVHKSQGSEYPAVIIPLLTQHYALLQRNLLYTAVTRGKKLVIIIGTEKALSIALENNRPHERLSRLEERLMAAPALERPF